MKLLLRLHTRLNCCDSTFLAQTVNQKFYIRNLIRICKQVCNSCYRCQRIKLIQNKNYISNLLYSYPKDHNLELNVKSLAENLNLHWQVDILCRLRVRNSKYTFVQSADNKRFSGLEGCKIFVNVMVFINCRTNFVFFEPLYSKSFSEIKIVFAD